MNVGFLFAGLAMSMKGVKVTSVVLSATPVISTIKAAQELMVTRKKTSMPMISTTSLKLSIVLKGNIIPLRMVTIINSNGMPMALVLLQEVLQVRNLMGRKR